MDAEVEKRVADARHSVICRKDMKMRILIAVGIAVLVIIIVGTSAFAALPRPIRPGRWTWR